MSRARGWFCVSNCLLVALAALSLPSTALAGVAVSKTGDFADIASYNIWLHQNRDSYKALPMLHAAVERLREPPHAGHSGVVFYDQRGIRVSNKLFSSKYWVRVSRSGNRVYAAFYQDEPRVVRTCAVFDQSGNQLFSVDGTVQPFDGGLYFQFVVDAGSYEWSSHANVLDETGTRIGRIELPGPAAMGPHYAYSSDTTYVVAVGGGRPVVIDRQGQVLWDSTLGGQISFAISDDSRRVVVCTHTAAVVHDLVSANTVMLTLPPGADIPRPAISSDGSRIAIFRENHLKLYDRSGKTEASARLNLSAPYTTYPSAMAVGFLENGLCVVIGFDQKVVVVSPEGKAVAESQLDLPSIAGWVVRFAGNVILSVTDGRIQVHEVQGS
jgi:outer membrane protein assembly factor BamB